MPVKLPKLELLSVVMPDCDEEACIASKAEHLHLERVFRDIVSTILESIQRLHFWQSLDDRGEVIDYR